MNENKQAILDALTAAVQLTDSGATVTKIEYVMLENGREKAVIHRQNPIFQNESTEDVNISMDSGTAMIRDVMRRI